MAITLQRLCEKASYLYGLRVLAGAPGMNGPVQWVHVVEDAEAAEFLHGGELIFTTGIAQQGTEWLLPFAEELHRRGACGLVVNCGPYLAEMPAALLAFCNENQFPLMDIPWKTRLVDITRDFCNQIIRSEKEAEDIGTIFKNLMYYPEELPKYLPALESHNFDLNGTYRIVGAKFGCPPEQLADRLRQLRLMVSRRLSHVQAAFFESKECLFAVLENLEPEELHRVLEQFQTEMSGAGSGMRLAAGEAVPLRELSVGFRRTAAVLRLAERRNQSPLYYDELSTEKLLISVSDTRVLEEYRRAVLGRLESYDHENGTHFVEILERYLFCDGSVQKVAEEMFVHRNTVNYQINRIKKILGKDLSSMEERMELMLAFQIRDVL